MVQIDIPAAFIASQLFLDIGKKAIKKEAALSGDKYPTIYYRYLFRSVFFAGIVISPAGIYLLAGWPGWEQLYWTPRVESVIFNWVNALIPAFFIIFIVAGAWVGHVLGYYWILNGKEKYLKPSYIGLLAAVTVVVLLNYPAFMVVGTWEQYHMKNMEGMGTIYSNAHDFSVGWVLVMLYFATTFSYLLYITLKDSKK